MMQKELRDEKGYLKEIGTIEDIKTPEDLFGCINFPIQLSIDKKIKKEQMGQIDIIVNDDESITLRPHPKSLEGIERDKDGYYIARNPDELTKVLNFCNW